MVVELLGGTDPAARILHGAVGAGRHVVTANKAVLAACGPELLRRAEARGVKVLASASVGGGVPALEAVQRARASGPVDRVSGVLNGTTTFVLDQHVLD